MALVSGSVMEKAMRFESGAHAKSLTSFSTFVTCCASPPSEEITYSCFLPSGVPAICAGRSERKAIHFPSGDHSGFVLDFFAVVSRSEEHTSELQSRGHLVCRLLLEKKKIYQ